MRILLVDNYDSFTWNIEHMLVSQGGVEVKVMRNDAINPAGIVQFDGIVLSPGPGLPEEAGQLMRIIPIAAAHQVPMLGVCLGLQAIVQHFGGTLVNMERVLHGQTSELTSIASERLFEGLTAPLTVGHYHSWIMEEGNFPPNLELTARNEAGLPMAIAHPQLPIDAVQFHPESVLTPEGPVMFRNWINQVKAHRLEHPAELSSVPVWLDSEGA
jgi:anthranilate synthase component 2